MRQWRQFTSVFPLARIAYSRLRHVEAAEMDQSGKGANVSPRVLLSDRQTEILILVGKGLTSKEIARTLSISPSTVDNHVKAAVDRLGARNRLDAFRRLESDGHLSPPLDKLGEHETINSGLFSLLRLPPLGGRPNRLETQPRLLHVLQIAALALVLALGAILTISGVVHVLDS